MHECIIGLWHSNEHSELVTFEELKENVAEKQHIDNLLKNELGVTPFLKSFQLADYFDKRKSTNFYRFDYCCGCGKKIDWKQLRVEVV